MKKKGMGIIIMIVFYVMVSIFILFKMDSEQGALFILYIGMAVIGVYTIEEIILKS